MGASGSTLQEVSAGASQVVSTLLGDEVDAFLFDCDGTLYQADELLPHVAEVIGLLRKLQKRMFFVTNTSSRSREQLCSKLARLGIECEPQECVPSCVFTADYVRRAHPTAERVYVIGGQGVVDELAKVGITSTGGPEDSGCRFLESEFAMSAERIGSEKYDGVVVGWDTGLNYYKMAMASLVFQQHPNAFFYATNDDPADRIGQLLLPGNGPALKGIEAACAACAPERVGRDPPFGTEAVVLGKPNPEYARLIAEWNGIDLRRAVMVGDRLDTDILMGQRAGLRTLFVLSGVDGLEDRQKKGIWPDHTLPDLGFLWTHRPEAPTRSSL